MCAVVCVASRGICGGAVASPVVTVAGAPRSICNSQLCPKDDKRLKKAATCQTCAHITRGKHTNTPPGLTKAAAPKDGCLGGHMACTQPIMPKNDQAADGTRRDEAKQASRRCKWTRLVQFVSCRPAQAQRPEPFSRNTGRLRPCTCACTLWGGGLCMGPPCACAAGGGPQGTSQWSTALG